MTHFPELTASYMAMSPWARSLLRNLAKAYALRWPAPKQLPALTLVPKPLIIEGDPNLIDNDVYRRLPVVIR